MEFCTLQTTFRTPGKFEKKGIKKIILGLRYPSESHKFQIIMLRINQLILEKLIKAEIIDVAKSMVTSHWLTSLWKE